MSTEAIIEMRHVTKSYQLYGHPMDRLKEGLSLTHKSYHRDHVVLDDFNLVIRRGESVGFVGKNGAGKSTLLKLITGVLTVTSGTIETRGKIAALLELGAGFNVEYTGRQNIYLNGKMMGYTKAQMEERVDSIIEFADIGEFIDQPVRTYSSGMFARLAFAVSINVSPDILIVDEVLSVGDTRFQMKCIDKMKELKERGTTILFVSHTLEQIKRFCTRAVWMKDGHIEIDGEASEVVDLYDSYMRTGLDVKELLELKAGKKNKNGSSGFGEDTEKEGSVSGSGNGERKEGGMSDAPGAGSADADPGSDLDHANPDQVVTIDDVELNDTDLHTFDPLEVRIKYTVYKDRVDEFSFGAAIYSVDRKLYVFGPNTYLEKVDVPNTRGHHTVIYRIPRIPLIQGIFAVDVGIFSNGGLVNLDYKISAKKFVISNAYFTEGTCYMEHEWIVEE